MTLEGKLLAAIGDALPASIPVTRETADDAPQGKGAYALVISLGAPAEFLHKGRVHSLPSGCYIYAGSARGPGGIAARLRRHFRPEKKPHWHVDRLTLVADEVRAFALEGASECGIVARLSGLPGFRHPLSGFGSSDCPACRSHLLQYRP